MNSPNYFSVYPPTNQLLFSISALGGGWRISLIILKILAITADIGSLMLIRRIAAHFKQGVLPLLIYGLNPLVILEFSGNVHSEVFMVFFIALAIWLFIQKKNTLSALSMAFAICSKLIPVLILPFFISKMGWKKGGKYFLIAVAACFLLFLPLIRPETLNAQKGLSLYFNHFEFYSGLFQLGKWLNGYWYLSSTALKFFSISLMIYVYFKKPIPSTQDLLDGALLIFTLYFLFSASVHPWYIAALVFYTAFSRFRYVLVWNCTLCFTYITYQTKEYLQYDWVLWTQSVVVISAIVFEAKKHYFKPQLPS